jgi:hypothetical protein
MLIVETSLPLRVPTISAKSKIGNVFNGNNGLTSKTLYLSSAKFLTTLNQESDFRISLHFWQMVKLFLQ